MGRSCPGGGFDPGEAFSEAGGTESGNGYARVTVTGGKTAWPGLSLGLGLGLGWDDSHGYK